MTPDEIRVQLRRIDEATDGMDDPELERAAELATLHKAAEAAGDPRLELEIRWETQLAYANTRNATSGDPAAVRFTDRHPDLIQPDALEYLKTRLDAPSLHVRARVADFLWSSGGATKGAGAGSARRYLELLPLLIEQAPRDQYGWLPVGDTLVRAAQLAKELNQRDIQQQVAQQALELTREHIAEGRPRYIIDTAQALTLVAPALTDEEAGEVVESIEWASREFRRVGNFPLELGARAGKAEFGRSRGLGGDFDRQAAEDSAWALVAEARSRQSKPGGELVAAHFLDAAAEQFEKLGSHRDDVNNLRIEAREARERGIKTELRPMAVKVPIDSEALDKALDAIADGATAEVLARIATRQDLTVSIEQIEIDLQKAKEIAPFSSLMPHSSLRSAGVVLAPREPTDQERLRRFQHAGMIIDIQNLYLEGLFRRLMDRGVVSDDLLEYLHASGHFDDQNLELIGVGLQRIWDEDYVSAVHVLVPQLEDVLRRILRESGTATARPHKEIPGVSVEITLGAIVPKLEVSGTLTADQRFLFDVVFADLFGANLRNEVGHGLIRRGACNSRTAARLLQLYLIAATLPSRS